MKPQRNTARRRGGIYIAVLGTAMVVSLIGMASLATLRSQRLTATATADAAKARLYAQSAAEIGMQLIAADPAWRKNRTSGAWVTKQAIDDGLFSISIIDPKDGDLGNRPTDPITVQGTGLRGNATQIVQATMVPTGAAIDALAMALHVAGELAVVGSQTLTVTGAPASTNTNFRNAGTVAGSVQCLTAVPPGTVTGTLTLLAPVKAMPDSGIQAMYVALGTAINPGSTVDRVVLGPGVNPYGATNADGVYVITSATDITIRRCRIYGTLVIVCPGKTVTIQDNVFMQPARADYPTLIIDGNLALSLVSSSSLSESSENVNFNPVGAPYLGATDSDKTDTYPSELDGLIHIKGTVTGTQSPLIRGVLLCESAALTNAVVFQTNAQIIYDPTLYSSPPMGYTKSTAMVLQPGSWKQVVLP